MPEDAPTVLVIEDDAQLLSLYRHYLEDEFEVRTASSGADGLERFDDDVDLVLLDRRMPRMSGDEVLSELRDRGYDGPVTMVTAVEPDTDIVDLAFDDYIVKPVSRADIETAVETMLGRATYDASIRSFFALSSKVAVLEAEHARTELEDSEDYRRLTEELEAARREAKSSLGSLDPDDIEQLFRDIGAPTMRSSSGEESADR